MHRKLLGRQEARALVEELSAAQCCALSRHQLSRLGVPRWFVRGELKARRWQAYGRQVVLTHNGPVRVETVRWAAVLQVGRRAALDGVTALQHAGVTGLTDRLPHVITPKGSTPHRPPDVVLHESRRFREQDVLTNGVRRTRVPVAAVHAALWARTRREAAYVLLLVVQQRLATPGQLAEVAATIVRHRYRTLIWDTIRNAAGGVHSLGELDVAADFRRRGLPEPSRQVLRTRPSGNLYLDCRLDAFRLVLEIDGAGHGEPWQRLDDLIRDISCLIDGDDVLRLPLEVYALDRERVLDAIERLLIARGWQRSAAA